MTREQQKQLNVLQKSLNQLLKKYAVQYHVKKKDYMIYYAGKEFFYDALIFVSVNDRGQCICTVKERLKPIWLDDLLWDLLGMPENKDEPVSLRAVGAFAVSGAVIWQDVSVMQEWSVEELDKKVEQAVAHFAETIGEFSMEDFVREMSQPYHGDLRMALYYIHESDYQKALDIVGDTSGVFQNGDLDINDAIRRYCVDQ